ncbi:MAG: metallophosphoesterase [Oscillatoriales cyanobacterium]|nr:MAG: metallophosphoesterase [Oscillatoriales cyanobacterium]
MKIAVMSCIHGNYEALNAVLSDIDEQQADKIFCLGDLVGYGPNPHAVVEMIRSLDIPTCVGCWDEDIVEGLNSCECSYPSALAEKRGKLAHEWTNNQIFPETREYLATLPHSLREENMCFVHGSPHSNHEYLLPTMDAFSALERVFSAGADFTAPLKRIVNVGSVGEPRHGRPNATYVIYDVDAQQVILREVEYDYQTTCAAIIEKGLPPIFAWRLARGLEYAERADDPTHVCER